MAQVGRQVAAIQDRRWAGPEPVVNSGITITQIVLANHLNWYNYIKTVDHAREYLQTYLTDSKDPRAKLLRKVPDKYFRQSAGWIANLMTQGAVLEDVTIATFNRLLDEMFGRLVKSDDVEVVEVKPNVQQRTFDKAGDIIADIEDALDHWKQNDFSLYKYLSDNKISAKFVSHIVSYYKPLLDEVTIAVRKTDKQVTESYSYLKKNDLTAYMKFLSGMINDAERYGNVTRAATPRKPRVKKSVSLDKKLENVQYMEKFDALQIKSVTPASIVGASEIWLYDTAYKKMTLLRSESHKGLDIKGTTVFNFDPATSKAKRIGRRTQTIIDGVLRGTKIQARKVLEGATSEAIEATGRISKSVIILRVFK